jgi:AcrR family transcriptional regulator
MEKHMSKTATKPVRKVIQGPVAQAQILDAVDELFYKEGARAVGVDAVAKHAGVNKMCLYRQFESKDGLLLRYLERRDQRFWDYFAASQVQYPDEPRRQLLNFFQAVMERTREPGYRGCAFVNIATEFPDREHPARQLVAGNKIKLLGHLQELAARAGAADPQVLAHSLGLLLEGAYTASQTYPAGHPILAALPQAAATLMEAACNQPVYGTE